ncbi:hypothetical protein [Clostridium botulinum]|nr:hypothetical protein RSJ13_11400 [Clostridium botulinum]
MSKIIFLFYILYKLILLNNDIRCIIKDVLLKMVVVAYAIAIIFYYLKEFFNICRILNVMLPNGLIIDLRI